jgi:hypothetical protein
VADAVVKVTRELAIAILFVCLAALMTWPLVIHLDTAIAQPDDPFVTTWALDWDYYATFHHASLFDANIFSPARYSLAFSEHMYGIAILFFPLFAAGVAPLTIHNLAMLLGFAACGYAMFLLTRWITGSIPSGIVAGIAFAFVGTRFHHLPHLSYVWAVWLPLILLAILIFARRPSVGTGAFVAATLVMNGLTALHWFVFGTAAAGITAIVLAFATNRQRDRRFWLLLAASFGIAMLVLLPFLLPYSRVAKLYGMRRYYADALPTSAAWRDWLIPNLQSKLYGRWSPGQNWGHERTLFPGFTVYGLAIAGLGIVRRTFLDFAIACLAFLAAIGTMIGDVGLYRGNATPLVLVALLVAVRCWIRPPFREGVQFPIGVWAAILWVVLGAAGARGLNGPLHTFLFTHFAAYRGIRMPVRWAMIAYVGLSVLAGFGMLVLLRERRRVTQAAITCLVCALMLFELRAAPIRWYLVPVDRRPLYEWLAKVPLNGSILELPLSQNAAYEYLWRATTHHHPLINGVSSYTPSTYDRLTNVYENDPIPDELLTTLENMRCSLIVVHAGWLRDRSAPIREWLQRGVQSQRLMFVRSFDAGIRADYVFAVMKTEPRASSWRDASQNVTLFLHSDGWTYVNTPIASVDRGPSAIVRGPLTVSGWALAPAGVAGVNLRFANGRTVVGTTRIDRPDVKALMPWYPHDPRPGFTQTIAGPPANINGDTDMQVEIVDRAGHVRRQPPYWFSWHPRATTLPEWRPEKLDDLLRRLNVDPAREHVRIVNGTAAIQDFTAPLVTDANDETNHAFVERILTTLFGDPPSLWLKSKYLELLSTGTSRERVVEGILTSREFANVYLQSGRIVLD